MAKKEFSFKGKSLEELQALDREQFGKLLNSRGKRSLSRNINKPLEKQIDKAIKLKSEGKTPKAVRTHLRDTIVTPKMVGLQLAIYNGKTFELRDIEPEMVGKYFGELVLTRKRLRHGKAGIGATKSSTAITAR
ncbi:MAG: ribosomal protein S19 family protein [archaeon]|nr:ribosomal protein S19 family protein [archaeon]